MLSTSTAGERARLEPLRDEPELVRRAQLGSAAAFEQLVLGRGPALERFLVARLRDESDARDALQEALVAAWQALPGLRQRDRFWPWLVGIAAHKAADLAGRRPPVAKADLELLVDIAGDPDERARVRELWAVIESLPSLQRDVLLLRYLLRSLGGGGCRSARHSRRDRQVENRARTRRAHGADRMKKNGTPGDEQVTDLFERLEQELETSSEHDLRVMAMAATAQAQAAPAAPRRRLPARRRYAVAIAATVVTLLVGSSLGFGLASFVTPSGNAGSDFTGLGFLPARGWTVEQAAGTGQAEPARALAANVPLAPEDSAQATPFGTLAALPPGGIVVAATFQIRGDPVEDASFPPGAANLKIASSAIAQTPLVLLSGRALGRYVLRAGISGENVDARIYFGRTQPTARMLAAAQRQLDRLVVAADRVTIFARPTVLPSSGGSVNLFGAVESGKAGEDVAIQQKDCGVPNFRNVAGAKTQPGGGWSAQLTPGIGTTVRAVWKDAASIGVTVQQHVYVDLTRVRNLPKRFQVGIGSKKSFWHRRALVQRYDTKRHAWVTLQRVLLTESGGLSGYVSNWTSGEFTAAVPKGTLLRATLPASEAKPCYLPGTSSSVKR